MPKKKPDAKANYIERVRNALVTSPSEMPRPEYIEALEELLCDLEGHLEAAREEQEAEDDA